MRAIVHDDYGPPRVLRLEEVPRPVPERTEVLIRVRAASIGAGDRLLMKGWPYLVRIMGFGLRRPKLRIRGFDVAGVVEEVGQGVEGLAVGDQVFGTCDGSFAEFSCTDEKRLARKPAELTFEQAAAIPVSGYTALQAVRDVGGAEPGQHVLVIGAAGGVGSFAVQIAKALGARVTGVCSGAKADLVRSIGADQVIDYTRGGFAEPGVRYDLLVDTAGNRPVSELRRALARDGTLVIVGGEEGGRWFGGIGRSLWAMLLSPFVGQKLRGMVAIQREENLAFLGELVQKGALKPLVDRVVSLPEVPQAMEYLETNHARGKVVVSVAAPSGT